MVATLVKHPAADFRSQRCSTCTAFPTTFTKPNSPSSTRLAVSTSMLAQVRPFAGPSQTPSRMSGVSDHFPELDAALEFIVAEGHDHLVLNAHSTGGLIAMLWLRYRKSGMARSTRCAPC